MAKNMAKYLAIYGQIFGHMWPYIGHKCPPEGSPIFFFIDASARDGGRAGRRAGALASMKKKRDFAGLDPKMTPWGSKKIPSISAQ